MGSGVRLWVRGGDPDTDAARAFLRQHGYGADEERDLGAAPPQRLQVGALRKGLGGSLHGAVAWRESAARAALPGGPDGSGEEAVLDALATDARLLRAPVLLTPRGAVAGFRERAWRDFLGIGRERS